MMSRQIHYNSLWGLVMIIGFCCDGSEALTTTGKPVPLDRPSGPPPCVELRTCYSSYLEYRSVMDPISKPDPTEQCRQMGVAKTCIEGTSCSDEQKAVDLSRVEQQLYPCDKMAAFFTHRECIVSATQDRRNPQLCKPDKLEEVCKAIEEYKACNLGRIRNESCGEDAVNFFAGFLDVMTPGCSGAAWPMVSFITVAVMLLLNMIMA